MDSPTPFPSPSLSKPSLPSQDPRGYGPWNRLDHGLFTRTPRQPPPATARMWIAPVLLILTILSTIWAGASVFGSLSQGAVFSAVLLCILGVHESGHFLAARYWGVPSSLPYFIPFPLSIIGTMGAVIRLRAPIRSRKALFDIGAAGPLSGWILSVFALLAGYGQAQIIPPEEASRPGSIEFGSSLLMWTIEHIRYGDNATVMLNPFLYAGWIGMLVTALNLMPIGQLDGGHVIYAMFPRMQALVGKIFFAGLLVMSFFWQGWIVWAILTLIIGTAHPPTEDYSPIGTGRTRLGYAMILIFITTFIPVPVRL